MGGKPAAPAPASFREELNTCDKCRHCSNSDTQDDFGPRMLMMCSSCWLRGVHVVRYRFKLCLARLHSQRIPRRPAYPRSPLCESNMKNKFEFQECEEARIAGKLTKSAVVDSDTTWFCSRECKRVYETLARLVANLGPVGGRILELVGSSSKGRGTSTSVACFMSLKSCCMQVRMAPATAQPFLVILSQ
jgi:hypothetical protein